MENKVFKMSENMKYYIMLQTEALCTDQLDISGEIHFLKQLLGDRHLFIQQYISLLLLQGSACRAELFSIHSMSKISPKT